MTSLSDIEKDDFMVFIFDSAGDHLATIGGPDFTEIEKQLQILIEEVNCSYVLYRAIHKEDGRILN